MYNIGLKGDGKKPPILRPRIAEARGRASAMRGMTGSQPLYK